MRYLAAAAEIATKIVELVGVELKMFSGNLEGIYCLVGRRRGIPMNGEASIYLLNVKRIPVMGHHNVGVIQHFEQVANKLGVIVLIGLVSGIVWKAPGCYFLLVIP